MADPDRAVEIAIAPADPADERSRHCLDRYAAELHGRFAAGFDLARSRAVDVDDVRPPAGRFLLATRDGQPMGCVGLKLHDGWGEIKRMWVDPDVRGAGLGRRLLRAVEDAARTAGVRAVRLDTNGHLSEAIAMYRSAGYVEVPAYNDEPYADLWFEKAL